jgi:histidyl-tRNA synthetase
VAYFEKFESDLSEDSRTRLKSNPLRILDSKDEADQKIVADAPAFSDSLNSESTKFFDEVLKGLDQWKIPYQINPLLVRGLDYYNHTVFEFTTTHLGSQNAVLSGGRYNNLIETMGGPNTPGVGWAAGTDRLALLLEKPSHEHQTVALILASESAQALQMQLLYKLRENHIPTQVIYSGNTSKQMKKANKRNCSHVVVLGDDEVSSGRFLLKSLADSQQVEVDQSALVDKLKEFYV